MVIEVSNNIHIKDISDEAERWIINNLEMPNPDYAKKLHMGFSTYRTPKTLRMYEIHAGEYVIPTGCLRQILPYADKAIYHNNVREPVDYNCFVPLYPYQLKAVAITMLNENGILNAPAGSGKTQMGISIVSKLGYKALWLTHTADLLNQSMNRARQYMDESLLGTIAEGKVNIGKGITFALIQTMSKLDLQQYRDVWDVVIVDECHRVCGTPTAVTQFYKVLNNLNAKYKYGLTATVHRADGLIKATLAVLGDVLYEVPKKDVADKVMAVGIRTRLTKIPASDSCYNTDGTLNFTGLTGYLSDSEVRNKIILEDVLAEHEAGHSCLILASRLSQLQWFKQKLNGRAVMIDGNMTTKKGKQQREQSVEKMRTGEVRILLATFNLAKEGLDIPRLDRLFLATPQKDMAIIVQSIGRVARKATGKEDAVAYDYVDDIAYCKTAYNKRRRIYRRNNCYEFNEC